MSRDHTTGRGRLTMARFHEMNQPIPAPNWAESLCELGWALRRQMHCGAGTKAAWGPLDSLPWFSQLALRFLKLSRSVQFRAVVEDWPLHQIEEAVQAQLVPAGRP